MYSSAKTFFFFFFGVTLVASQGNRLPEICRRFPSATVCRQGGASEAATTVAVPETSRAPATTRAPVTARVEPATRAPASGGQDPNLALPGGAASSSYCPTYEKNYNYYCVSRRGEFASNTDVQNFCPAFAYYCYGRYPDGSGTRAPAAATTASPSGTTQSPEMAAYCQQYYNSYQRFCRGVDVPINYGEFCLKYLDKCERPAKDVQAQSPLLAPGQQQQAPAPSPEQVQQGCAEYQSLAESNCKGNEFGNVKNLCDYYRYYCLGTGNPPQAQAPGASLQSNPGGSIASGPAILGFPAGNSRSNNPLDNFNLNWGNGWGVGGIPYYPFNPDGRVSGYTQQGVDFGTWGGGFKDNSGVDSFWNQRAAYGGNWKEGQYGVQRGWRVPIADAFGANYNEQTGADISDIRNIQAGKNLNVGPWYAENDKVNVAWANGNVGQTKQVGVPVVGVGVQQTTGVDFAPNIGGLPFLGRKK